jgi:anti-sigma-K factor RskA
VTPSAGLKSRVLAVATDEKAPRPAIFTRIFWAAAAVVIFAILIGTLTTPDYERYTMASGDPSSQGYVLWSDREVKLRASGLARLPENKVYELWRIRDGKVKRAGEYSVDADGQLRGRHVMSEPFSKGDAFAVTIEPAGGTDSPTGPMPLTPSKK